MDVCVCVYMHLQLGNLNDNDTLQWHPIYDIIFFFLVHTWFQCRCHSSLMRQHTPPSIRCQGRFSLFLCCRSSHLIYFFRFCFFFLNFIFFKWKSLLLLLFFAEFWWCFWIRIICFHIPHGICLLPLSIVARIEREWKREDKSRTIYIYMCVCVIWTKALCELYSFSFSCSLLCAFLSSGLC